MGAVLETSQGYVRAGDLWTHYRSTGSGAPVILIHGAGNDAWEWQDNIQHLSQHHRVYAPDLPGYGLSDKPRVSYSIDFFVSFLGDFMRGLGLDRASLVGVSLGGAISVGFTLAHPDRVANLVLANSACLARGLNLRFLLSAVPWALGLVQRRVKAGVGLRPKRTLHSGKPYDVTGDGLPQGPKPFGVGPASRSVIRNLAGLRGPRVVFEDRLHEISCPTLIIWGAQDYLIPVRHAHVAHERIANSRLHIFDQCGHVPQRERAEDFNRLVLDFLMGAKEA